MLELLKHAAPEEGTRQKPLMAASDCKHVVDGCIAPTAETGKVGSGLEDPWRDIAALRSSPRWIAGLSLEKMRARQTLQHVERGELTLDGWRRNVIADRAAKRAAKTRAVRECCAARHKQDLELVTRVALHFARMHALCVSNPRRG